MQTSNATPGRDDQDTEHEYHDTEHVNDARYWRLTASTVSTMPMSANTATSEPEMSQTMSSGFSDIALRDRLFSQPELDSNPCTLSAVGIAALALLVVVVAPHNYHFR